MIFYYRFKSKLCRKIVQLFSLKAWKLKQMEKNFLCIVNSTCYYMLLQNVGR
jgi:hypothetical protein